jgi:hypothetical protein
MELKFTPRTTAEGFIALLKNVYYYTTRWGLSVKEFTGQHQDYWEKLPKRLRRSAVSQTALNTIIEELEILSRGSEERRMRRNALVKKDGFRKKEVVINEQLLAILSCLPHELLSAIFRRLTAQSVLPVKAGLVDRHLSTTEQLIEPDLLIMGGRKLLMGELKVKTDQDLADTKYSANQLFNYLGLAVKSLSHQSGDLPNSLAHIILLPSVELRWFIQGKKWISQLQTGLDRHMEFDVAQTYHTAQKQKKQKYVHNEGALEDLLKNIPVYCRTYDDLASAMEQEIVNFPLVDHWQRIQKELVDLCRYASSGV